MSKHDQRCEYLIGLLSNKTENIKSVVNIEEKVRQEMSKSKRTSRASYVVGDEMRDKTDLAERIRNKNLPENVRKVIEK